MSARIATLAALLLAGCASSGVAQEPVAGQRADRGEAWAARCTDEDPWDRPGPPFRVHGNTWYVGTCGITALLVTGEDGHVLIDGGTEAGAALIAANVEALGFALSDVKLLLASHEHHDHVGGTAELQRLTGARLLSSAEAAPVLASGKADPADPQFAIAETFPAARVDGTVTPGVPVRLGDLALTPIAQPGHTLGALSWQWQACEGEVCRTIVYADSLTPISADGYRFTAAPALVEEMRAGLDRLAALPCDLLLTPHPMASSMDQRLQAGALAGEGQCRAYADTKRRALDERLAREAAGTEP
ncbi:beta-lactamase [Croceibacterium mercuriale]|uniref:Beta-lactamase n=1 Tax=Croceibacterium mercuriale TaxID=1572751 RepID=A0A0B2C079_9SPHN|nr:subclass B3 metallo-beta-lactamase [Croceibacterium mercuriale]KHL25667.1 beta-lactamase [Croceibacterium mercuriale]